MRSQSSTAGDSSLVVPEVSTNVILSSSEPSSHTSWPRCWRHWHSFKSGTIYPLL